MANPEHLALLKQGIETWNKWCRANPDIEPDLGKADLREAGLDEASLSKANLCEANFRGANLSMASLSKANLLEADLRGANLSMASLSKANLLEADLRGANLFGANLFGADLRGANLFGANLSLACLLEADLRGADLGEADLHEADLRGAYLSKANLLRANLLRANLFGADLRGADLGEADLHEAYLDEANLGEADLHEADLSGANLRTVNLSKANLSRANLSRANLSMVILVETNLTGADLTGCHIYGISVWDPKLEGTKQRDLVITQGEEPVITVDNLEVAQFIYLLLHNEKIRNVIDTITSKAVLILGRFTPERKAILDALREELRSRNYLPILFDFKKPESRSFTETISTLAHMARFVIADITEAKSIPQELQGIVPGLPHLPIQPLLLEGDPGFAMFEDFRFYPWVLPAFIYHDEQILLASIKEKVIDPAEAKAKELTAK